MSSIQLCLDSSCCYSFVFAHISCRVLAVKFCSSAEAANNFVCFTIQLRSLLAMCREGADQRTVFHKANPLDETWQRRRSGSRHYPVRIQFGSRKDCRLEGTTFVRDGGSREDLGKFE